MELDSPPGYISGEVFNDINHNGIRDRVLVQGAAPQIVFIIDSSGSTQDVVIDETTGGYRTILDGLKDGIRFVIDQLINSGFGYTANISIIDFDSTARILDLHPSTETYSTSIQSTYPLADIDGDGQLDIYQAMDRIKIGGATNAASALRETEELFSELHQAYGESTVFFMTDGAIGGHPDITKHSETMRNSYGSDLHAFGLSSPWTDPLYPDPRLAALQQIDPQAQWLYNNEDLLDAFSLLPSEVTEVGLPDQKVYIDVNANGVHDPFEYWTLTDQNGHYEFFIHPDSSDLNSSGFEVRVEPTNPYAISANSPSFHSVIPSLQSGNYDDNLFGISDLPAGDQFAFEGASALATAKVGRTLELRYQASSLSGSQITYEIVAGPEGATIDSSTGLLKWEATTSQVGEWVITVGARNADGRLETTSSIINITPNGVPQVTSNHTYERITDTSSATKYLGTINIQDIDLGYGSFRDDITTVSVIDIEHSTDDGYADVWVTFTDDYPNRVTSSFYNGYWDINAGVISEGVHTVTLAISDLYGGYSEYEFEILVTDGVVTNQYPEFHDEYRRNIPINHRWEHVIDAQDPDGTITNMFLQTPIPSGVSLIESDELGAWVLSWEPTSLGTEVITVKARDDQGAETLFNYRLNVVPQINTNNSPVVTVPELPERMVPGESYKFQFQATDPDNDQLFWFLIDEPEGAIIDPLSGELTWRVSERENSDAPIQFDVVVRDLYGAMSVVSLTFELSPSLSVPVLTAPDSVEFYSGFPILWSPVTHDGDSYAGDLTFSLTTNPESSWLSIDPDSGALTGTPPTALNNSNFDIVMRVTDEAGNFDEETITIEILPPIYFDPETTTRSINATVGQEFDLDLVVPLANYHDVRFGQIALPPELTGLYISLPSYISGELHGELVWPSTDVNINADGLTFEIPIEYKEQASDPAYTTAGSIKIIVNVQSTSGSNPNPVVSGNYFNGTQDVIRIAIQDGLASQYDFSQHVTDDGSDNNVFYRFQSYEANGDITFYEDEEAYWTLDFASGLFEWQGAANGVANATMPSELRAYDRFGTDYTAMPIDIVVITSTPAVPTTPTVSGIPTAIEPTDQLNLTASSTSSVGISYFEYWLGDNASQTIDNSGVLSLTMPPLEGTLDLTIIAYDITGQASDAYVTQLMVDNPNNSLPTVSFSNSASTVDVSSLTNFQATINDVDANSQFYYGIRLIPLAQTDQQIKTLSNFQLQGTPANSTYTPSVNIDPTQLTVGQYRLEAWVEDE